VAVPRRRPNPGEHAAAALAAGARAAVVDVRESDARETLRANLPGEIDLLFLDGANEMYREVLAVHRPARGTPERWSWRTTPAG